MRFPHILLVILLWVSTSAAATPGLMLATTAPLPEDTAEWWVSEKLDGVRARWDGRTLWSRGGHRIRVPVGFTTGWPSTPLDGELWLGYGRFDATSALVRGAQSSHPDWQQLQFLVFDLPAHRGRFDERLQALQALLAAPSSPTLAAIPQQRHATAESLQRHYHHVLAQGGEGLILHHRDARYQPGRQPLLRKLTPMLDAEARVVGHLPGKGQLAGLTGALEMQMADGKRFRLGSGLNDALRRQPPAIGSVVTYRYTALTTNGLPRFPRFLRIRNEEPSNVPADTSH